MVQKNVIKEDKFAIREPYLRYKSTFPDDKIGFSNLAELQPKWLKQLVKVVFIISVYVCTIRMSN